MRQRIDVIVDLQFGSTGKGLLAGYLAEKIKPDTLITAWGPNAGHTYINGVGHKFVNIALPNGIVSPNLKKVLIGPGSIIDPVRFHAEMIDYADLLEGVEIIIHPHAVVVMDKHRQAEAGYGFKIGSTMKGVGEAVVEKIRREVEDMNIAREALMSTPLANYVFTVQEYNAAVDDSERILIEGAQGYSLSINHGFYPYVTSRDCTVPQIMADCGIPFGTVRHHDVRVHGVCRTFPIRVANRFKGGVQVGTSGPCYDDQREMQWEEIGREPELTTVTKLPRRLFSFSEQQVWEACRINGVNDVFINFCNYLQDRGGGIDQKLGDIMDAFEDYCPVRWLGWGPTVNDIEEIAP